MSVTRGLLLGEEPHIIQLSGPNLMCLWRTELGFLDTRYSSDYGKTWHPQGDLQPMLYTPKAPKYVASHVDAPKKGADLVAGSAAYVKSQEYARIMRDDHNVVRNPRGAITPFKLRDGKHVALLFYNNGHTEKVHSLLVLGK